MDVTELKKAIEENTLDDSFLVLQWSDNNFIAHQYVNTIAKNKKLKLDYIDDLKGYNNTLDDFFGDVVADTLYVMNVEKFTCDIEDFSNYKNVVVICKNIDCNDNVITYVVKLPKIEDWQINDYMKMRCNGINKEKLEWLQKVTNNNIYRIDNELSKISIFSKVYQNDIFDMLNNEGGYSDLTSSSFYDFINALKEKNVKVLRDLLIEIDSIDVEPMGIITCLHNEFKLITDIKLKRFSNQSDIDEFIKSRGISVYKFNAYRKSIIDKFSESHLAKIFSFITSVDYKLKSGQLGTLSNDKNRFIDYIICNILSV